MDTKSQAPVIGVYKIVNKVNGKYYIGSSNDIVGKYGRWYEHKNDLNANRHDNSYLQRSWNKYGASNFEFFIVEETSQDNLLPLEQKYLNDAENDGKKCYNLSRLAAGGGMKGLTHTEETKKKISAKLKGRPSPMKGKKRVAWMTKYLVDNFLKGEKSAMWKPVDIATKTLLFELYKMGGCSKARKKAEELGFGSAVFDKRLLPQFRKEMNLPKGKSYVLPHYKFMDDKAKDLLFSTWKKDGHYGLEKFAKENEISFHLIRRTLKEIKAEGYKRSNGYLYLNGKRCVLIPS